MRAPAIEARGLSKTFGTGQDAVHALDTVSLTIRENEFFTLLGPSGCGKTTLLRLIGGFGQPSAGDILLQGRPLTGLPPFKRPINTVFQSYALFPHLDRIRRLRAAGAEVWPGAWRADHVAIVEEPQP